MRKMKKFLCAVLASTMVLAMAAPSFAEQPTSDSGSSITGDTNYKTGSITIKNAIKGQEYNVYKIFDLDSYRYDDKEVDDEGVSTITGGAYSYKVASGWENFFGENGEGSNYVTFNNGYVSGWKQNADAESFAKAALTYANSNSISAVAGGPFSYTSTGDETEGEINIPNLSLGYYLVDSTTGALCSLNTTDSNAIIIEKNEVPTVEKKADGVANGSAEIGKEIKFTVDINAKDGAQNYKLHDKMDDALSFSEVKSVMLKKGGQGNGTDVANVTDDNSANASGYKQLGANATDGCDFEIEFTEAFCNGLENGDVITITYTATLTSAAIVGTEYENKADVQYGDNKHSVVSTTKTKTWDVDIFKYTGTNTGLANAVFSLSDANGRKIKVNATPATVNGVSVYTVDPNGTEDITTPASGHITIKGLASGTYTLTEEKAPNGYNKLTESLTIEVAGEDTNYVLNGETVEAEAGNTLYNGGVVDEVAVLNNTGALLPSTGGIGTTIFYAAGIVLMAGAVFFVVRRKKA